MNKKNVLDCYDWHLESADLTFGDNEALATYDIYLTGYYKPGTTLDPYNFDDFRNYASNIQHVNYHTFIIPEIKDIVFNPPATIVFWTDNTKTVVKCQNDEEFDPEKGITMAFFKKMHGNKGHYFEEIKKWCEKYYEQEEQTNQLMDEINSIRERILSGTTKGDDN
jgi:hypothetical protein